MTRKHIHSTSHQVKSVAQIVQDTQQGLIAVIVLMATLMLLLMVKACFALWPEWLVSYRTLFISILGFAVIFFSLMTPVILEFTKDPRPLSGPGKTPETG